jgi:hydroxymethylbilane synthase
MISLKIATRGGALALVQTRATAALLRRRWPEVDFGLEVITTQGDRDQRTALWDLRNAMGTEGFFTTQLEEALVAGKADLAVHSLKDLPTRQAEGLSLAALCQRQFPEDCLVAPAGIRSFEDLAAGARIGTSSLRRAAQVRQQRSDLQVVPIRGNVETRLAKLDAGQVGALILARAGLERLGLAGRISSVLDPRQFIPAPAQGTLAVQTRAADEQTRRIVSAIDEPVTRILAEAERQILIVPAAAVTRLWVPLRRSWAAWCTSMPSSPTLRVGIGCGARSRGPRIGPRHWPARSLKTS